MRYRSGRRRRRRALAAAAVPPQRWASPVQRGLPRAASAFTHLPSGFPPERSGFPPQRSGFPPQRSGFTIVEMLIAMAITLLMMAAVVNLFANLSTGVRDRRAMIEVGGQLRQARLRLARDLAGATCRVVPWRRPEANEGYLEIVEGVVSDKNPSALLDGDPANGELDYAGSTLPGSQRLLVAGGVDGDGDGIADVTDGRGLGDYDDILALTVRSDGQPFVGRGPGGTTIESQLAEVIWFAVENPADGSLGEPGLRRIYRRVLLIAPWLEKTLPLALRTATASDFFREVDLSARFVERAVDHDGNPSTPSQWRLVWTPNALGDLTRRESRFAHRVQWVGPPGSMLPAEFPHRLDTSAIRAPWAVGSNPLHPFGQPFEFAPGNPAEPPRGLSGQVLDRTGQDLMLDGALAFDVRAFDPGAPLVEQGGVAVEPSDLGWQAWADSGAAAARVVGFGAYADLAWNVPWSVSSYPPAATKRWQDGAGGTPTALFGGRPFWKSQLDHAGPENAHRDVCYDTWSLHYEHDGVDQADAFPPNTNNLTDATIDEGTNGIDDDNADGVDDPDERETSPPYAAPLTGVQVRLRVYEQEARQVRETSVIQDF